MIPAPSPLWMPLSLLPQRVSPCLLGEPGRFSTPCVFSGKMRCPFLKLFVQIPQPRFQSMSDPHKPYFCFQAPETFCIQEMAATEAACRQTL